MFEEMVNNLRHSDSFRFGTVVREDPMAEDGSREGADIVDRNMSAVVQQLSLIHISEPTRPY